METKIEKTKKEVLNNANEMIKNSFSIKTDEQLLQDLNKVNFESLAKQTNEKNNSIWKKEVLKTFNSFSQGRNKLRKLQNRLCKTVLHNYNIKDQKELINSLKELKTWSEKNLLDIKNFSNRSETSEFYTEIKTAYKLMFLNIDALK